MDNRIYKPPQGGPLSFAEVFRMIQAGEEIPGLQKLDIKPSNQQPTVSQMLRKLKPWEKTIATALENFHSVLHVSSTV
uniref:Peroxisomal membrane protein PEX14-like KPWE domain-containing protein n=1 Tax=Pygocentrus nattereri TaxID=42514 RepID=A0A3B4E185_PYGNA